MSGREPGRHRPVEDRLDRWQTMQVRRSRGTPKARIALVNRKGGSGKTTTAIQLAAVYAAWGLRVRLTDADPQLASATSWMPPLATEFNLSDVFLGRERGDAGGGVEEVPLMAATSQSRWKNLWFVPSYPDLRRVEVVRPPGADTLLRDEMADDDDFDIEIIDTAPNLGTLSVAALVAADHLIAPFKPSGLDYYAFAELKDQMATVNRRINPSLDLIAIVICGVRGNTQISVQLSERLKDAFPDSLQYRVPQNVRAEEAPQAHEPLTEFAPDSPVMVAYWGLAEAMLPRLGLEVVRG